MATETKPKPATEAVVGPVRLSYLAVFKPRHNEMKGVEEFSAVLLIPKEPNSFCKDPKGVGKAVKGLIDGALESKFGKAPAKWDNPLKDGDVETNNDGEPKHPGYWYVNTRANLDYPPALIDGKRNKVFDGWQSGDWGFAKLKAYAYEFEGKKGVGLGLRAIQFTRHDEPFGSSDPTEGFEEVEGSESGRVETAAADSEQQFDNAADDPFV